MVKFQSTHLHEVWRWVYMKIIRLRMFQSTHLHEVWPNAVFSMASAYLFQSTHLHEVWPPLFHFTSHVKEFQSTHLHEVWQSWQFSHDLINSFNPHTYMRCDPRFFISLLMSRSFNPHTYMRCDRAGNSLTTWLTVSIHTPTWGVTISSWTISVGKEFQSTHLHEVWRQRSLHIPPTISFNPHTYMRCDKHYANLPTYNKVSIHTPTWGVTVVITTGVDPVSFNPHTYMRCDKTTEVKTTR